MQHLQSAVFFWRSSFWRSRPARVLGTLSFLFCLSAPAPASAEETLQPAFPWAVDQDYTYSWVYERQKVGETRFRLTSLEKADQNPVPAARYRLTSEWIYEREGTARKSDLEAFLSPGWSLLRYRTSDRVNTLGNKSSFRKGEGWREEEKLVCRADNPKERKENEPFELPMQKDTPVLLANSVELMALFIAQAQLGEEAKEFSLAYPEFGKVYSVRFALAGEKSLEIPGRDPVPCRHYRFESKDKQYSGEVWVDKEGRLWRYRQDKLVVQLEPAKRKS
ncbi:MAG: hypothetical protein HY717_08900 [Planctomycetes bacterium]|nr:hypothetical protein [Planctomycetota bacterium]